jgi:hypothetical protein
MRNLLEPKKYRGNSEKDSPLIDGLNVDPTVTIDRGSWYCKRWPSNNRCKSRLLFSHHVPIPASTITKDGSSLHHISSRGRSLVNSDAEIILEIVKNSGGEVRWPEDWNPDNTEVCKWTGISCFQDEIEFIELPSRDIAVDLSVLEPLCRLPKLRVIDFSSNQLTGSLSSSWSVLSNMQQVTISDNRITGSLPSSWSNLTNLMSLDLRYYSTIRLYSLYPSRT